MAQTTSQRWFRRRQDDVGPQQLMFEYADQHRHNFFVARDVAFRVTPLNEKKKQADVAMSKTYSSFANLDTFLKYMVISDNHNHTIATVRSRTAHFNKPSTAITSQTPRQPATVRDRTAIMSPRQPIVAKLRPPQQLPDQHLYEIIREDYPCRAFIDLEWKSDSKFSIRPVLRMLVKLINETWNDCKMRGKRDPITTSDLRILVSEQMDTDIQNKSIKSAQKVTKVSYHVIIPRLTFRNIADQQIFWNHVFKKLVPLKKWWVPSQLDGRGDHQVTFMDFSVYSKNRLFRLPYSSKLDNPPKPRLWPLGNHQLTEYFVTGWRSTQRPVNVSKIVSEIVCARLVRPR